MFVIPISILNYKLPDLIINYDYILFQQLSDGHKITRPIRSSRKTIHLKPKISKTRELSRVSKQELSLSENKIENRKNKTEPFLVLSPVQKSRSNGTYNPDSSLCRFSYRRPAVTASGLFFFFFPRASARSQLGRAKVPPIRTNSERAKPVFTATPNTGTRRSAQSPFARETSAAGVAAGGQGFSESFVANSRSWPTLSGFRVKCVNKTSYCNINPVATGGDDSETNLVN